MPANVGAVQRKLLRRLMGNSNKILRNEFPSVASFAFDTITSKIHIDGRYESDYLIGLEKQVFQTMESRKVCFDVGANIGNHTLFFAKYFDKVFAFEPHPRTFKLLECNAMLADNVVAHGYGLSDQQGVFDAVFDPANFGAAGLADDQNQDLAHLQKTQFELKPLDSLEWVKELPSLDFMKIDIERHEPQFLKGAGETLRHHKPIIAMEILESEVKNGTTESIEILKSYGYTNFDALVDDRFTKGLPKAYVRLSSFVSGLTTNRRSERNFTLSPAVLTDGASYSMVICSC